MIVADRRIDLVRPVPERRPVAEALEQVEVAVGRELGDLAHAPRRRLHVLRERDRVDRHADLRQQRRGVVVEARLPLRRQHRAVALAESGCHERPDPLPRRVVAERLGRVVLHRVVRGREGRRQRPAVAAEGDLGLLPFAHEAGLAHAGSHDDRAAHQLRALERELDRDQRSHRQPDQHHRRRADRLDQRGEVARVRRDVPRRRRARVRGTDAARVVGRVAVAGLERRRLVAAPVRPGVVSGGKPDDVGARAGLLEEDRRIDELELRHRSATASASQSRPSSAAASSAPSDPPRAGGARSRGPSISSSRLRATIASQPGSSGSPGASSGPAASTPPPAAGTISTAVSRCAGNAAVSSSSTTTSTRACRAVTSGVVERTEHLVDAEPAPRQRAGDGPDEVVLRLLGVGRHDARETVGGRERPDPHALDRVRGRDAGRQARGGLERRRDRALRPAAARVGLDVQLLDPPARAEPVGRGLRELAAHAGEAAGREQRRADADECAPGARVLGHRRVGAAAHDRRDRRVVLGEAERGQGPVGAEAEQARGRRGRAEPTPRAGGVVGRVARVQGDARANRHLVADDDRGEQVIRVGVGELRGGERRRDHDRPRMALGETVAVIEVERVGKHPVGPGGAGRAEPPAVVQRGGVVAGADDLRVLGGDQAGRRPAAADADRRHVGEQEPDAMADADRDIREREALDELGEPGVAQRGHLTGQPCCRKTITRWQSFHIAGRRGPGPPPPPRSPRRRPAPPMLAGRPAPSATPTTHEGDRTVTTESATPGLLERLAQGTVICAEGYLFEFERRGYLQAGAYVPEIVLEHPEMVAGLHREFVHAGSDVVEAFTYYAHREKLRIVGKEHLLEPINREALAIASAGRRARPARSPPATSPTPTSSRPTTTAAARVRAMFEEQVGWIVDAGMDFVVAETFSYAEEALIALEIDHRTPGCRRSSRSPIHRAPETRDGLSPAEACARLADAGADVVGLELHPRPARRCCR